MEEKKELAVTQNPGLLEQQVKHVIIQKLVVVQEDIKTEAMESVEKVNVEEIMEEAPPQLPGHIGEGEMAATKPVTEKAII